MRQQYKEVIESARNGNNTGQQQVQQQQTSSVSGTSTSSASLQQQQMLVKYRYHMVLCALLTGTDRFSVFNFCMEGHESFAHATNNGP